MAFDWQVALGTALVGVGEKTGQMYDDYKGEQLAIRQEDRRYQTEMRKEQEKHNLAQQREAMARKQREENAPDWLSPQDRDRFLETGALPKQTLEEASAEAGARTTAELEAKQQALDKQYEMMYPEMSPEQRQQKMAQDMQNESMTAAQKNEQEVMGIINGAKKDEMGNPVFSKADKLKLGIYGVKLPQEQRMQLDNKDHVKIQGDAMKYAQDTYGDPDKVSDVEILNMVNSKLPEGAKQVKDPQRARNMMIRQTARNRYIFSVNSITGSVPPRGPSGESITEEQAANAIATVEQETSAPAPAPEKPGPMDRPQTPAQRTEYLLKQRQLRQEREAAQSGQAPVQGLQGYGMPETQPQVGTTKLPEQQNESALQGDPRVDDIIGRMNQ